MIPIEWRQGSEMGIEVFDSHVLSQRGWTGRVI